MRTDEEFARKAFHDHLAALSLAPSWSPGAEPPDYFLTIGDSRFPVEVTLIMESVAAEQDVKSERGWQRSLERIVNRTEAEMVHRGVLRGVYAMHLEPVPNVHEVARHVLTKVEAYLRDTSSVTIAPPLTLWNGTRNRHWKIEKVGDRANMIGGTFVLGGAKWQAESRLEVGSLIEVAAATKRRKTSLLSDVVLLLVDAYHYAEAEDWQAASEIAALNGYHTVARVFGSHECQVLQTTEASWCKAG